ncbi:response regulator transcription factor [Stenotrophomonas sp.]|uniref:response regulator transcription factor n=1 Tax=Stenotrophomonas sp. TaxID=69392 RepID=UPI0028B1C74E|nr:response regulator transcription factor [Stenotrophomonas sp.]
MTAGNDNGHGPAPMARAGELAGLHVWVVEDDPELLALLLDDLAWRGATVRGLGSAEALYRALLSDRCDIVVLDVGLPGEDGYAVASHLRASADIGIVMLTGRGDARDMAMGLTQGADLYLIKPPDLDVLAAGLRSLRRRLPGARGEPAVAAAPPSRWEMSTDGWTLHAPSGARLALTAMERGVLQQLFAAAGVAVTRDQLIAQVTDNPWDFDPHRLDVLVHRLRARVRSATGVELPIRALRGQGYLLTG